MGILTSPQMSAAVFEISPENERVTSMQPEVAQGKTLTVVCLCA